LTETQIVRQVATQVVPPGTSGSFAKDLRDFDDAVLHGYQVLKWYRLYGAEHTDIAKAEKAAARFLAKQQAPFLGSLLGSWILSWVAKRVISLLLEWLLSGTPEAESYRESVLAAKS
jgi:hypothetical protein